MLCFRMVFTVALLALAATGAAAQEKLDYKVGTRLSYIEYDAWKKEVGKFDQTVLRMEGENYVIALSDVTPQTEILVSPQGIYTRPMPNGNGTFAYTPVKLPLNEGVEWEYTYRYIGKNFGSLGKADRKCVAGALEDIEVPAGRFNARKFTCKGYWRVESGTTGTSAKTAWFAPSIGVVVKSIDGWRDKWASEENTTVLHSILLP